MSGGGARLVPVAGIYMKVIITGKISAGVMNVVALGPAYVNMSVCDPGMWKYSPKLKKN